MLNSFAWQLEGCYHILGTKFPLMTAGSVVTVFEAGGLLYVDYEDHNALFIVDEGLTIDDIDPVYWGDFIPLGMTRINGDATAITDQFRFPDMWAWEWDSTGRNRWQEMKDRGGDVSDRWLGDPPNRYWGVGPVPPGPMADVIAALDAEYDAYYRDTDDAVVAEQGQNAHTEEPADSRTLAETAPTDNHLDPRPTASADRAPREARANVELCGTSTSTIPSPHALARTQPSNSSSRSKPRCTRARTAPL